MLLTLMAVNRAVTRQRLCHITDRALWAFEFARLVPRAGFEPATP